MQKLPNYFKTHFCSLAPLFVCIGLFLVGTTPAFGSSIVNPGPVVTHINAIDGHSAKDINLMLQDKSGFIWFVKYDGLMRFDGYTIKAFHHDDQNPHSLANNFISAMVEDDQGYIWLATDGGLSRFNPKTEHFDNFTHDKNDNTTLDSDILFSLSLGSNNQLWIGSAHGINAFDRKTLKNRRLNSSLMPSDDTIFEDIHQILEDSTQRLWFYVDKKGLYQHNLQTQNTIHFDTNNFKGLYPSIVSKIVQSRNGIVWIGTHLGLNRFNSTNSTFERIFIPAKSNSMDTTIRIESITEDATNRLWIGTLYNGVSLLTQPNTAAIGLNQRSHFAQTLPIAHISDIMQDASASIWFASPTEGMYKLSPKSLLFDHYTPKDRSNFKITAMLRDDDNLLWLGSGQHLYRADLSTMQIQMMAKNVGIITTIDKNDDASVVFSVIGHGRFNFNKQTGSVTNTNNNNTSLEKNKVSQYLQQLNDYTLTSVLSVDNRVFAGTSLNGLRTLNTQTGIWSQLQDDSHDIRRIWHLYQDRQQRIWIATDAAGLAQLDLKTHRLSYLTMQDGLPTNSIRSIVEDNQGALWLGTANGIARFNPQTKQINVFNRDNGIRVDSFEPGLSAITAKGDIIMASTATVVRFSAPKVTIAAAQKPLAHPLLLTDFRLFNQPVNLQSQDPQSPLTNTINATDVLTLSHDQHWFSLSFASSNYNALDNIRYAYKMEGLSKQWIEADKGNRTALFTAIGAKDYVFKVKSTNPDGSWSSHHRQLKIVVTPPLWQTWQAYLLYLVVAIGGMFAFYRFRTQSLIKKADQLEQMVIERTTKINALMEQKEHMFANISHEFKTPLTLIITPMVTLLSSLERELPTKLAAEVARKKSMMLRNGQRLLRMIDQLLKLSALESENDEVLGHYSLKETLDVLLVSFKPLLDNKHLTLRCDKYNDVILTLKADTLEIILTNLISNAIKYTPDNGDIAISIKTQAACVEISVTDSGIGISPENQQLVFNRFTRASAQHHENIPGAGIGLALVKELIDAHEGSIDLTSTNNQGCTFVVTLPICTQTNVNLDAVHGISSTAQNEIDSLLSGSTQTLPAADADKIDENKTTVLLIDDNADMLELLVDTLHHKYNCLTAEDGEQGLQVAREQLPDLVISDVMMPGIDGYEVVKQLKQDDLTSHLPVILLTAKGDMPSRLKGWAENVDEYLAKPFNVTELLMRVENLLSIRRLLQQRYQRSFCQPRQDDESNLSLEDEAQQGKTDPAHLSFTNQLNSVLTKYYNDVEFNVSLLSKEMHLSIRQLNRKMKAILDLTPVESIRNYRLKIAAEQLKAGAAASTVAYEVGFTSHSYFSQCFKAQYDCSPSRYCQR